MFMSLSKIFNGRFVSINISWKLDSANNKTFDKTDSESNVVITIEWRAVSERMLFIF